MKSIAFIPALMFLLATGALGSEWIKIPGSLKHITASINYLWGVNSNDDIFMCARPCTGGWVQIPGKLKQIDAGDMEVWGVTSNDDIFKRAVDGSGIWQHVGGKLRQVSASGNGYIWGVNLEKKAYKCKKPCKGHWEFVADFKKQADGGFVYVYAIGTNSLIYHRAIDGSGFWSRIPGNLKWITSSGIDELFGVNSADEIWRCKEPCGGEWKRISGGKKQVDAAVDVLVGVNKDNNIWKMPLSY